MPGATPTSTSSGFGEAIAVLSASVSASASSTFVESDAVAGGDRGGVEGGQVEARRVLDLLDHREPLEDRVLGVAKDEDGQRHVVGGGASRAR